ncbi:MAG: HigA family addiction module antidote protein [Heliobacteriaceae bacterium]|jgi:addiction module HigA family antidote|nr:HigA family addiction module antidote protein [Heliobacteriaceae bacterium]
MNIELPSIGEILKEEFLEPFGLSQNALAKAIFVPPNRIHAIINNTRKITADTDLRLTKLFGLSECYFLRLQESIETRSVKRKIIDEINAIKPIQA